jgi:two-component system, OmpR family, response regulator VicR
VCFMPTAPGVPTILVVEDDWLILELLRTVLQSEGLSVMVAPGPLAAVGLLKAHRPDLIVTDFFFGTTPETCRKSLGDLPAAAAGIPMLAVTGRRFGSGELPVAFGVDDIISKPFDVDDILKSVRSLLGRSEKAS